MCVLCPALLAESWELQASHQWAVSQLLSRPSWKGWMRSGVSNLCLYAGAPHLKHTHRAALVKARMSSGAWILVPGSPAMSQFLPSCGLLGSSHQMAVSCYSGSDWEWGLCVVLWCHHFCFGSGRAQARSVKAWWSRLPGSLCGGGVGTPLKFWFCYNCSTFGIWPPEEAAWFPGLLSAFQVFLHLSWDSVLINPFIINWKCIYYI